MSRDIKFKAVMQKSDGTKFVSEPHGIDNKLSYLFDFNLKRWDEFLEIITTSSKFVSIFEDEDEYLNGWVHIENIQYTGLKDKNRVEIYEGDILKFWDWVGFIRFSKGVYLLEFKDREDTYMTLFSGDKEMSNYEVIGNIYENEDLLT